MPVKRRKQQRRIVVMDKVDVIILMWFCFWGGVVMDSWVSLTQQIIKDWRKK